MTFRSFSGNVFIHAHSTHFHVGPQFLPPMGCNENYPEFNTLLMKDWLGHCQRNHTKCQNTSNNFLPTRLLDVEAFKSGEPPYLGNDIRLVSLSPDDFSSNFPSYIALSYCWGPPSKRPITTTITNLSDRLTQISFLSLPQTFRDAVDTARRLGIRYLWIDSLCIIQDCKQDWAREASLMSKVFSHTYCTLAALSSKDGSEGLQVFDIQDEKHAFVDISTRSGRYRIFSNEITLRPGLWSWFYSGRMPTTGTELNPFRNKGWPWPYSGRMLTTRTELNPELNPLRLRAWVLQERELSRRTVHFSTGGLLWECKEVQRTAQVPWEDVEQHRDELLPWFEVYKEEWDHIRDTQPELVDAVMLQHRLEKRWWLLVEDYSGRLLTEETDRLIALSGVARAYQEEHFLKGGVKYGAGLWSSHLPEGLLWQVVSQTRSRHETYIAPSWSWASVKGSVRYDMDTFVYRLKREMAKRAVGHGQGHEESNPALSISTDQVRDELKVEEMTVSPKYDDPYGALNDASLVLSGARMVEVDSFTQETVITDPATLRRNGEYIGCWTPDGRDWGETCGGVLMCLGIRIDTNREDTISGLLLKEVGEEDGVVKYRRIGVLRWVDVKLFEGVEPRRIILK